MTKSIIFDLDETLFDRPRTLRAFLARQYQAFKTELGVVSMDTWIEAFIDLDEDGRRHKSEVYRKLQERFAGNTASVAALLEDYYENSTSDAIPMAGMDKVLDELKSSSLRLAILTNGETRLQTRTIEALSLFERIEVVVISQAVGMRKPDAEIFNHTASMLESDPQDCVYIGDNPRADIIGAYSAGMKTIWFRREGVKWPDDLAGNPGPEITELSQLLEKIL